MNPFPFRPTAQNASLARTISEIVAPKTPRKLGKGETDERGGKRDTLPSTGKWEQGGTHTQKVPQRKTEREYSPMYSKGTVREGIGSEGDTHGGGATSPKRDGATAKKRRVPAPVVGVPTTPRVSEPLKISEDHTRAQLEKLSVGQLRALYKKYSAQAAQSGIPKSGLAQELANIRGLLRSKGAGSVLDECGRCMGGATDALAKANAEDLKEKPGKAGERAHKRLHKTIARVVGEEVESVDEGVLGRIKKKLQRAGEHIARAASPRPTLKDELQTKQNRHAIAAAAERRKREAEDRKHPKPKTKTRNYDFHSGSRSSDGDDGGWMGAAGI